MLLSSHTLSEVESVADRVAILRRGRLVVVDSLEGLRAVAIQRLEIEFIGPAPRPEELRAVPGVREVTLDGPHLVVAFEGSADALVKALAAYEVRSIRSRDDDLEEIFLGYYRDREVREPPGLEDDAAAANADNAARGIRDGGCHPDGGGALPGCWRLDRQAQPSEGHHDAARGRRLRNAHRLDAQRDRRRVRAPARRLHRDLRSRRFDGRRRGVRVILALTLGHPVSGSSLVLAKAAAVAISVALVALATLVGLVAGVAVGGGGIAFTNLAALALHLAFFGWVAGALALAVAASTGRRALASGVAAAFVVLGFLVNGFAPLVGAIEWLKYSSLFHYYEARDPITNGVDAGHLAVLAAAAITLTAVAAVGMRGRDLRKELAARGCEVDGTSHRTCSSELAS